MRTRGNLAAVAGASAAAVAHALDGAGLLPFVHESAAVRHGLTPLQLAVWLFAAAGASAFAAGHRVQVTGPPLALAVAAAPELLARHDLGAVTEPAALVGAALQLLVVASVVALALLLDERPPPLSLQALCAPRLPATRPRRPTRPSYSVRNDSAPRAPPLVLPL